MADPLSRKEIASQPPVMSDDHSELAPLLPIPNRTVKRLCADDSVHTYVKVGHRQTPINRKALLVRAFLFMVSGVDLLERSDNTPRSGLLRRWLTFAFEC